MVQVSEACLLLPAWLLSEEADARCALRKMEYTTRSAHSGDLRLETFSLQEPLVYASRIAGAAA
jgi:hypothetical protein